MRKKILKGGLIVLIILALSIFIWSWIKTGEILSSPRKQSQITPAQLGLPFEEIKFQVKESWLSGWFVPGERPITIIFIPGWGGSKFDFLWQKDGFCPVQEIWKAGFSLAFFDPRGLGESEGELFALGYFADEDIKSLMDFFSAQKRSEKFILFGFSAGANAAIRVALEEKERIMATIADSPFISPLNTKAYPPFIIHLFCFLSDLRFGFKWLEELDLGKRNLEELNNIFLIVGEKDKATPPENAKIIFERAKAPKSIWIVKEAEHCQAHQLYPQEYLQKILQFLKGPL